MKQLLLVAALFVVSGSPARADTVETRRNSELTQGNVQLNLKVGQTTKAQVLEAFGAPNITTRDGNGQEVWSYQRHATVAQSSEKSSFWTILLIGGGRSASGLSESSRTMTLIIKFGGDDIVSDFRSRSSEF